MRPFLSAHLSVVVTETGAMGGRDLILLKEDELEIPPSLRQQTEEEK